ncbi:MAG: isocitrate lyase/PEP mutase family protein [Alphaproteobacteria bacterium]|nr:isocitrate lyase/PEP mutase family protein [Alphaproteobacteria bacterium]
MTTHLRRLLRDQSPVRAAGVFDAISAKLAERAGFACIHASGGSISRAEGYPDLGLLGLSEMTRRVETIVQSCNIPVVADADTGYGNALNAQRTVREYERAGAAGLHMEDQVFPKRCGLFDGIEVVRRAEMVGKIKAAVDARRDRDFLIIARSDAVKPEGLAAGLDRAAAYLEAGADMLFMEAVRTPADLETVAKRFPGPKLFNMAAAGEPCPLPFPRMAALGYSLIIYPSDSQRVAIRAMSEVFAAILRDGHAGAMKNALSTPAERDELADLSGYMERSKRYGA